MKILRQESELWNSVTFIWNKMDIIKMLCVRINAEIVQVHVSSPEYSTKSCCINR